jgi:hypothetical protein
LPHVLKFRFHADWLFSLYRFFQPRYIPSGAREKKTLDGERTRRSFEDKQEEHGVVLDNVTEYWGAMTFRSLEISGCQWVTVFVRHSARMREEDQTQSLEHSLRVEDM